jgi:peptide/nickel transport system permease protein
MPEPEGKSGRVPAADGFWSFVRRRPRFLLGYAILALVTLAGLTAPWLAPHSPIDADASAYLVPPGPAHPLGTDAAGLDVLSRVLWAPRIDLTIAILGTVISATLGGLAGAFVGGWEGQGGWRGILAGLTLRGADIVQAFPVFAFALVLTAVLGQGVRAVVLSIAFVNIPVYLRLMRTQVLTLRGQPFVEAATVAGGSGLYTLLRHIVPNAPPPILAQVSLNTGWCVLLAAGLSFIGAGVQAPTPEWGSMIASGFQNMITGQWWPALFPGLALSLTVLGFGLVSASIEAWLDPRQRMAPSPRAWRRFRAGAVA